jgi:hypothetical protein
MKDHRLKSSKRRDFLKLAGLGAGAAGVAAAGITHAEAKVETAKPEDRSRGYRESEHVKKYYALARF